MNRMDRGSSPAPDLDTLLRLIRDQSAAETAQLRAQVEDRARHIRLAAEAEADAFHRTARAEGERRGQRQAAKLLARAEADSHRRILWARENVIDDAIARARERLARFASAPEAPAVLTHLLREALAELPPGPVRVRLPVAYEPLLDCGVRDSTAEGHWTVSFVADPTVPDGILVETEDGRLCFDNTFAARIRRRQPQLRRLMAEALVGAIEVER